MDVPSERARGTPPVWDADRLRAIEGWLTDEAADLTARLVHFQRGLGNRTGILELGVYKGKYLAFLAAIHRPNLIPIVGIEGFLARLGEPLATTDRAAAEIVIRENVRSMLQADAAVVLFGGLTRQIDMTAVKSQCPLGYSFISVDAGHEADDLVTDMGIAVEVVSPIGIVAVDDMFNPMVPGVVEGVFRFFQQYPQCDLRPFAICGNKVFFARGGARTSYLAFCRRLLATEAAVAYSLESATLDGLNRANNFVPRLLGEEIVFFVWNERWQW
jgi:hypothetical protein